MKLQSAVLCLVSLAGALSGCSEGTIGTSNSWSRDRYAAVTEGDLRDAARFAVSQWFRIDDTRSSDRRVMSFPNESVETQDTGRASDGLIGTSSRIRRTVDVRFNSRGDAVVECRVKRERLDTSSYRAGARRNNYNEAPTETPIQTEGGVSDQQREVWTEIGRDRGMERQILDALRRRLEDRGAVVPREGVVPAEDAAGETSGETGGDAGGEDR